MKKTLIAFAALSAIAGMAQAQSTVTLYGLLDANVGSAKTNVFTPFVPAPANAAALAANPRLANGSYSSQRQTIVGSGGLNGSRFGFRITEDLGGGLAAIGNLEGGLSIDTGASGQGGLLFGRQANVGVASASLGTVTIGRNKSPYYDVHASVGLRESAFDATSNTNFGTLANYNPADIAAVAAAPGVAAVTAAPGAAAAAYLLSNHASAAAPNAATWLGFNARVDNSIRYTSPNFSGFSVSGLYGFGENKTPAVDATKTVGASVQYANGPIGVYLAYQSDAYARTAGLKPALENILVGASYDFGVAKVGANYNRAKLKDVVASGFLNGTGVPGGSIDAQKEYGLSVSVPFGATVVEANYGQSKGDTLGKASAYGVQALYSLSKRTTLYTGYSSTKTYDRLAQLAVNSQAGSGSNIGRNSFFAAGVRHTF